MSGSTSCLEASSTEDPSVAQQPGDPFLSLSHINTAILNRATPFGVRGLTRVQLCFGLHCQAVECI